MKIESAEIRYVVMPLLRPWRTAYGEDAAIHSILVRLRADGVEGWGESSPFYAPTYSAESAISVYETCREFFLPRVVGQTFASAAELLDRLAIYKGNHFAKAAVETAWWSLDSQHRGVPLWRALGGKRSAILCGQDFGVQDTLDELLELIGAAVAEGFPRIKLKVKRGWDIAMLEVVRTAFPKAVIHVDCNSGYDLDRDWGTLKAFDRFHLAMIEQPLGDTDLLDHAELQRRIGTPVCLDESIKTPRDFRLALKLGSCRVVNVKPGRVGGLQPAREIHDLARDAGVMAWVGGMLESAVGTGLCAALATLPGFTYPADIFPSRRFYARDLGEPEVVLTKGCEVNLGETAGVGFRPNLERLEAVTVRRAVV